MNINSNIGWPKFLNNKYQNRILQYTLFAWRGLVNCLKVIDYLFKYFITYIHVYVSCIARTLSYPRHQKSVPLIS